MSNLKAAIAAFNHGMRVINALADYSLEKQTNNDLFEHAEDHIDSEFGSREYYTGWIHIQSWDIARDCVDYFNGEGLPLYMAKN